MTRVLNNHITWLLSAGRDRRITLWKLIDGKVMTKSDYPPFKSVGERALTGAHQAAKRGN